MSNLVENRKYIRTPEVISAPKVHIKDTLVLLLKELFDAEDEFGLTDSVEGEGLKIVARESYSH